MAVSTAMPAVARDLDAVRSYGFAFSVMLTAQLLGIVLAGVWSDRSGPMVGAVTGQALLAAGAAMCGFAANLPLFLAGRALTGLGGGLLVVMLYVIAGRVYPEAIRPRLFTYVSAAWVLPSLLGPPVSAWLTTNLSWRWVFWGVVPPVLITLAVLAHARRRIDDSTLTAAVSSRDHSAHVRIAWAGLGIALSAGALQLGTYELVLAALAAHRPRRRWGWSASSLIAPMLVPPGTWRMARGLPERDARAGPVHRRLLREHHLRAALPRRPARPDPADGRGWPSPSGRSAGPRAPGTRGTTTCTCRGTGWSRSAACSSRAASAVLSAVAWLGLAWWIVPLALVVTGVAMGLGVTTTTVLALELSPVEEHGAASSSLQLADVLGSVLGIAAATAAFAAWHDARPRRRAVRGDLPRPRAGGGGGRAGRSAHPQPDRPRAQRPGGALLRRQEHEHDDEPHRTGDDGDDPQARRRRLRRLEHECRGRELRAWPWWPCRPGAGHLVDHGCRCRLVGQGHADPGGGAGAEGDRRRRNALPPGDATTDHLDQGVAEQRTGVGDLEPAAAARRSSSCPGVGEDALARDGRRQRGRVGSP